MKKQALKLLEGLDSMGPLKDFAALGIFSSGLEEYVHAHKPEDFPRATTRGHFDVWRLRATPFDPEGRTAESLGVSKDCYLRDGHDATDYSTIGDIPGRVERGEGEESPEEITIFFHGWLASPKGALGRFSIMRYSLETNGYEHPVVGYTWDTEQTVADWRIGKVIGRWNGPKLARFLREYKEENPETRVRCISNSLGAHPLFGAIKTLDEAGHEDVLESATVLGGTAPCSEVSLDGKFGEAVENAVGELHNYWSPNDRTLKDYYKRIEGRDCVGGCGARGTTPKNCHDHRVDKVSDHFSYFLPEKGCIDDVVRDFGLEPSEEVDEEDLTVAIEAFEDDGHEIPLEG